MPPSRSIGDPSIADARRRSPLGITGRNEIHVKAEQATPRVAVVTGAGRGIGAAIARRLAMEGHAIEVLDISTDDAETVTATITGSGGVARAVKVDVADADSVDVAVNEVADTLGPPTILVNNAGVVRDNLLFKMSLQDWDTVMEVHLRGAFLMARAVQGHMVTAGFGRIVNMSSTSAQGVRGASNYAAAKAGLQGFTKSLALELGRFNITVNAVAPGFVETDMTRSVAQRLGVSFDEHRAALVKNIAVGRSGQPEDIAGLIAYLVGDDAGYVSGQVIYAAGGP